MCDPGGAAGGYSDDNAMLLPVSSDYECSSALNRAPGHQEVGEGKETC